MPCYRAGAVSKGRPAREDVVKTTITLPADLWRLLKIRAVEERRGFRDVVIEALRAYLKGR